ncbi:MAG: ATP-binding protein [Chloroflexi bacterium]|nr:ATP-binding protein [Chloroflexota bacterium]MDA1241339.1 ATP-binding protein [Chloroflexota bacterium]
MPGLRDSHRLSPDQVTALCDPDWLGFDDTNELATLEAVFGQERAVRAIEFALGMSAPGYNLYAAGPDGYGKSTIVELFLRRRAASRPAPMDWVYVYNFQDPDHPAAISLPPGQGHPFAEAVKHAVEAGTREITAAFDSDSYVRERQQLVDEVEARRTEIFEALQVQAQEVNFALQFGPAGIRSAPLIDGKPATEEQFAALPDDEKAQAQERRRILEVNLQEALLRARALEREAQEQADGLDLRVAAYAISDLFEALLRQYGADQEIQQYLETIRDDIARNRNEFRTEQQQTSPIPGMGGPPPLQLHRYEVNVVIANDPQHGAPVVFERNPTYYNLIGRIEYQGQFGTMVTNHTLIRAGSLAQANGGYLILRIRDLLNNGISLEALKRSLSSRQVAIENLSDAYPLVPTTALRPEPIPLSVKVVIIGDSYLYSLLYRHDPDFREHFKVKADFEVDYPRTAENTRGLASVINAEIQRGGLRPFTRDAVSRLIEHSSRMVQDRRRLSANMSVFLDLVRQADYWATMAGVATVDDQHVVEALEQRTFRSGLIADRIMSAMEDGTIRVETQGTRVGEINALSVYDLGDISFGRPSRVTCVVSAGRGTIVMVERESEMAGRIHNKGFLILRGFLTHRFGQDRAAALHASLTFEQLYGDIDGDSASSTELYVLLSALSEQPVAQHIAVTGSVDQLGRVQPIGGVTDKIEGYYDLCRARGLDGTQGVMIPRTNVAGVILRPDVAQAVADGQFHVWAIDTVEEGIEILTGIPAGDARGADRRFPEGTIYRLVEDRLAAFAASQAPAAGGTPDHHVPMPPQGPYPTPPGIPPSPPPDPPVIV